MVVGQWAGSKPSRGRGAFGMQVVSVGGPGKGRGRDPAANKMAKPNKKGSTDSRSPSQVNGTSGNPVTEEESSSQTIACALSRDCSDPCSNGNASHFTGISSEGGDNCRDDKLGPTALQKEE